MPLAHRLADTWLQKQAGVLWKGPKVTPRARRNRTEMRRQADSSLARSPAEERRELMQRMMNLDTVAGIRANEKLLSPFTLPDRSHPYRRVEEVQREKQHVHAKTGHADDRCEGEASEVAKQCSELDIGKEKDVEVSGSKSVSTGTAETQLDEMPWSIPKTFSIPALMSIQGFMPHKPLPWPVWKVRHCALALLKLP